MLITGGAGFIGSNLVDALLNMGCRVRVVDSLERGSTSNLLDARHNPRLEILNLDLSRPESAREAINGVQLVFDLAARVFGVNGLYKNPGSLFSNNARIALNVAETCAKNGVELLVYASSSCIYDFSDAVLPHIEDNMGLPVSFYGSSKLFGEIACSALGEEYGLNYSIARIFNTYGPRESLICPHVIPEFIMKALACKRGAKEFTIIGDGQQTRSFLFVDDLVDGLVRIAQQAPSRSPINLGSSEETRIMDLAKFILELTGVDYNAVRFVHVNANPNDVRRRAANNSRAFSLLGWKPITPLKEGLQKTIAYYARSALPCPENG